MATYAPFTEISTSVDGLIRFNMRIMTRDGEVVIDFGDFKDLLSYSDSLSVESPAGSWNLKMRASLANEQLLRQIHPGLVAEVYCARNDDPLKAVEAFSPQGDNPAVFTLSENTGTELHPDYAPIDGVPQPPPAADWEDYLDKAPYLLMRGVTTAYGRSSSVMSGAGAETTLTLSGETYGKVYRDAQVLSDINSPTSLGKSLEVRYQSQDVNTVVPLYYGILRHWVEQFWGEETQWEARTRPIPVPPDLFCRIGSEGSVWSALQYLSLQGIFHQFVDHTGAIVWEKLPYSGRCQTIIDQEYLKWSDTPLRNWEDLPLTTLPSWQIIAWADRLSCDRLANYVRCQLQGQMGTGAGDTNMDAGQVYNMGSIRQYGGPKKLEVAIPARLSATTSADADAERETRISTVMDLVALEVIRWYDRPVQRVALTVRGDAGWRINCRTMIAETWHNPEAEPGQYLILSRAHSINITSGQWTTQLDAVRDRRNRYLGAGLTVPPGQVGVAEPISTADGGWTDAQVNRASGTVSSESEVKEFVCPIEADEYWAFQRNSAEGIAKIGGDEEYQVLIAPYLPADCEPEVIEDPSAALAAGEDGFTDGGVGA